MRFMQENFKNPGVALRDGAFNAQVSTYICSDIVFRKRSGDIAFERQNSSYHGTIL